MFGIDYSGQKPDLNAAKKQGVKFIARYLSHDVGKNLGHAEAKLASDLGLDIVVVWETTANRALAGKSAGMGDAQEAQRQALNLGMPADRPIYFAVDFDATPLQQQFINEYFRGVNSVLGTFRTGAYGGFWPVSRLFNAGLIRYGWQTYAWSGSPTRWDPRAQIQQYSNGHTLAGGAVDFNHSMATDYGQWSLRPKPKPKKPKHRPVDAARALRRAVRLFKKDPKRALRSIRLARKALRKR